MLRGMDLEEGATTMVRNKLIGGHNANEQARQSKTIYAVRCFKGLTRRITEMLEDAAEYRVEVYKHISGIWYKLTEINADRQNGYVAITDLVGDGYVFRVVAEDRSGNILSRSAGMVIGYDIAG